MQPNVSPHVLTTLVHLLQQHPVLTCVPPPRSPPLLSTSLHFSVPILAIPPPPAAAPTPSEALAALQAAATSAWQRNAALVEAHNTLAGQLEGAAPSPASPRYRLSLNHFAHMSHDQWAATSLGLGSRSSRSGSSTGSSGLTAAKQLWRQRRAVGGGRALGRVYRRRLSDGELPAEVDWRGSGADGPGVKDQVSCGSCWVRRGAAGAGGGGGGGVSPFMRGRGRGYGGVYARAPSSGAPSRQAASTCRILTAALFRASTRRPRLPALHRRSAWWARCRAPGGRPLVSSRVACVCACVVVVEVEARVRAPGTRNSASTCPVPSPQDSA